MIMLETNRESVLEAAEKGQLDLLIQLLRKANFDKSLLLSKPYDYCDTPFSWAARRGHLNVVEWISKLYVDICSLDSGSPLHRACEIGSPACVRFITDKFRHFTNEFDHMGRLPIQIAARRGYLDIVNILIESGASVDATAASTFGGMMPDRWQWLFITTRPALMLASMSGNLKLVELLLQHGANPLLVIEDSHYNETLCALSVAAEYESFEVLKCLSKFVPLDKKYGLPAVLAAVHSTSPLCLQFLLENGAPTLNALTVQIQLQTWYNLLLKDSSDVMKCIEILHNYESSMKSLGALTSFQFSILLRTTSVSVVKLLMQSGILEIRYYKDRNLMKPDMKSLYWDFPYVTPMVCTIIESHFPVDVDITRGMVCVLRTMTKPGSIGSGYSHEEKSSKETFSDMDITQLREELEMMIFTDIGDFSYDQIVDKAMKSSFGVTSLKHLCRWRIRSEIAMKYGVISKRQLAQLKLPPLLTRYLWF